MRQAVYSYQVNHHYSTQNSDLRIQLKSAIIEHMFSITASTLHLMNLGDLNIYPTQSTECGGALPTDRCIVLPFADGEYSGYEIREVLRRYGIRIWGRKMEGDQSTRIPRQTNASRILAEYLLCRAGVPLTCAPLRSS